MKAGNHGNGGVRRTKPSFRPDQHRRQTQTRLILGGMLILLVVGGGLAWLLYGSTAAVIVSTCLLGAAAVMALLWLILALLEAWVGEEEP
jgi:hypothetical protein